LICADGSPSSKRIFPMLKILSPAIKGQITVAWVRTPKADFKEISAAKECLNEAREWLSSCGKEALVLELHHERPLDILSEQAGDDSVVVMGASLKHDLVRRTMGSLPIRMLAKTKSSVLVVKRPPVGSISESEFICKEIG
ncbi:MAG: universal stress protein, partial [Thermodesulfobacteriota bacterium]